MQVNSFIHDSFRIPHLLYNPSEHTSVMPYSPLSGLNFYQKLALPLEAPNNRNALCKPYNWPLARMKLNINFQLVKPLVKYLCNPMLTTIPFHKDLDETFMGLSIVCPDFNGVFVVKSRSFPTVKPSKLHKESPINQCCYCKGLTLLDSHRMNLVYFVPDGMLHLTSEIIDAWEASTLTICTVHLLHRSKRISNWNLREMIPNL